MDRSWERSMAAQDDNFLIVQSRNVLLTGTSWGVGNGPNWVSKFVVQIIPTSARALATWTLDNLDVYWRQLLLTHSTFALQTEIHGRNSLFKGPVRHLLGLLNFTILSPIRKSSRTWRTGQNTTRGSRQCTNVWCGKWVVTLTKQSNVHAINSHAGTHAQIQSHLPAECLTLV